MILRYYSPELAAVVRRKSCPFLSFFFKWFKQIHAYRADGIPLRSLSLSYNWLISNPRHHPRRKYRSILIYQSIPINFCEPCPLANFRILSVVFHLFFFDPEIDRHRLFDRFVYLLLRMYTGRCMWMWSEITGVGRANVEALQPKVILRRQANR